MGHAPDICLNGPSYLMPLRHKRFFLDRYYFKRYSYFRKSYRFLFYLILRNNSNTFWPWLSEITQNADFNGNGALLKKWASYSEEKILIPSFDVIIRRLFSIIALYIHIFRKSLYPISKKLKLGKIIEFMPTFLC